MLEIMAQEFRALFKGRFATIAILFGVPIVYTLLFGLLYSANIVKNIPLVIFDQDQTATSHALIQAFADSERYDIVGQVSTQDDMEQFMHNNAAMAAVVIPAHFSRDIKLSRTAGLLLELNATNLMFANNVLSTYPEIVQTFAAGVGQKLVEGMNQPPDQALKTAMPVRISVRIVDNPTVSYSNFILPGLSINGLQIAIYLVSCTLLTSEYAALVRRRELPVWKIILGKLAPCWSLSVLSYLVSILLLVVCFQVPFRGNLFHLLLMGGAFSFAICALGLFVSSLMPHVLFFMQNFAMYIMSAFLCSGYSWPLFAMNDFGRTYAIFLPITYAAETVRDIMLVAYAPKMMQNALILLAFGSFFCLLAIMALSIRRKRLSSQTQEGLA